MNTEDLLLQQKVVFDKLVKEIAEGKNRIGIRGKSGCGKSYLTTFLTKYLENQDQTIITLHFEGDSQCITRDYYPFVNGLKDISYKYNKNNALKRSFVKAFSFSPVGGDFLQYISELIMQKVSSKEMFLNNIFQDKELEIVLKLKKISEKSKLVIYLDNLHWWDEKSLTLLYLILQHAHTYLPEIEKSIFICNITDNQKKFWKEKVIQILQTFNFSIHRINDLNIDEYTSFIGKWNHQKAQDFNFIKLIWGITGGHLEVTKKAVIYNEQSLNEDLNQNYTESAYLNLLVEKRLDSLGATGEQINEVLKFASLIGNSFTICEMEHIFNTKAFQLKVIIDDAKDLSLIDQDTHSYKFSHEIIRELFEKKTSLDKYYYYPKIISCFKELYPNAYSMRIHYLLAIGNVKEIVKLYIIDIAQQLQISGTYNSISELEILLIESDIDYIRCLKKGIRDYHNSKYFEGAQSLNKIENIYCFDLLALRDLLIAQCYTKILDESKRMKAVSLLENYKNSVSKFGEQYLWSTCMLALLDAYIHIGQRKDSLELVKSLYSFYAEHAENCELYKCKLNILRRKSMAIYELEVSESLLEKSVSFFSEENREGFIKYPVDYYIALVNYGSVLICRGEFKKAHQINQSALNLQHRYHEFKFPRSEILINNFFMSGILAKKITPDIAINNLKALVDNLYGTADIYFIKSNLSIYYMIMGDLDKAKETLMPTHIERQHKQIKEYSYFYHSETNLALVYLLENNYESARKILVSLNDMVKEIHYTSYYQKRHEILKQMVREKKEYKALDFANALFEKVPNYQTSSWRYFGITYSFNTLEHWGES